MKRMLAMIMILLMMGSAAFAETEFDLSGMSAEQLSALISSAEDELNKAMQEERIMENSLEMIKEHWRDKIYSDEWYTASEDHRGYLEIIHAQIIYIRDELVVEESVRETAENCFKDVYCIVEFQMMSDYYGASNYYFNTGRDNCVAVYRDGSMEVHGMSLFDQYRSRTYSVDFSGIVDSAKSFGSVYDAVYYLMEE